MFCLFVWFYLILLPWRHHRITIWWWISLDFFQASSQQAFLLQKLMHPSKIKGWNPKNQGLEKMNPVIPFEDRCLNPPNISGGSDFGCLGPRAYQKVMIFSFQPLVFRGVFLSMAGLAQAPSSGIHVGHTRREHLWWDCHWCCTQKQATRPRCSAVMRI